MAGDWLKIREDLHEDPAVIRLGSMIETRPEHVVGYLVRFWSWMSRNSHAGSVTGVTVEALESVLNLPGFCLMLVEVGWLNVNGEGVNTVIEVPKFERHMSQNAKQRALSAERQRKNRESRSERDKSVTREEKRREENNNPLNPPKGKRKSSSPLTVNDVNFPDGWTDAGRDALAEWLAYKRERGQAYKTSRGVTALLKEYGDGPESEFVAAVRHSIAANYAGCFRPKDGKRDPPPPASKIATEDDLKNWSPVG